MGIHKFKMFELLSIVSEDYHLYDFIDVCRVLIGHLPAYCRFPEVRASLLPMVAAVLELKLRNTFEGFKEITKRDQGHADRIQRLVANSRGYQRGYSFWENLNWCAFKAILLSCSIVGKGDVIQRMHLFSVMPQIFDWRPPLRRARSFGDLANLLSHYRVNVYKDLSPDGKLVLRTTEELWN